jgi:hypothetical protein
VRSGWDLRRERRGKAGDDTTESLLHARVRLVLLPRCEGRHGFSSKKLFLFSIIFFY